MRETLLDIVGSVFYAIGLHSFASTAGFAPGGVSGLAIISNYLWGLPIGIMSLVFNIPLVILSFKFVGRRFLIKTARSMIFCTVFLDLVFANTATYSGSPLLAAIYSGAFLGIGMAIFYMHGSSSGGIDFLTITLKVLRPHMSIGFLALLVDILIILLGWPVFGSIDAVLYGAVSIAVMSVIIDKIMYGIGTGKLLIIITEEGRRIAERISSVSGRGSTLVRAIGTYTWDERDIILCACSKAEAYKVRKAVYSEDERAFVMISETSEVFGEGFIAKDKEFGK